MRKRFAHGRLKGNRSENPGQSRCCVPPLFTEKLGQEATALLSGRRPCFGRRVRRPAIARREILNNLKLRGMDFHVFNAPRRALED